MIEIQSGFLVLKMLTSSQEEFLKVLKTFLSVTSCTKLCFCFPISSPPFYSHFVSLAVKTYLGKEMACKVLA